MAQESHVEVTVWPASFAPDDDPLKFHGNYLSFISGGTYGIPARIADRDVKDDGFPVIVIYVNTGNVNAIQAVRTS